MTEVSASPYPLPAGHAFGPRTGDIRWHDGRESFDDRRALIKWQTACRERFVPTLAVSGVFDGPTQAAVCHLERLAGLPVDGLLGPEVWEAVWAVRRPERPAPPADPKPAGKVRLGKFPPGRQRSKYYWERMSRSGVHYGVTPDAPPWYPGRPFGPNESGHHVREVQELLGLKPTGAYNLTTTRRIRGLQRMADLPVSGIVDVETARIIDPPPWTTPADITSASEAEQEAGSPAAGSH